MGLPWSTAIVILISHPLPAGVIGGVTALVAAPALGAKEEGAVGFLKGLGAGVFTERGICCYRCAVQSRSWALA